MNSRVRFAVAAVLLTTGGPLFAEDAASTAQPAVLSPADEMKALRARLDQLEAQQKTVELQAQVLRDAQKRSMLYDSASATAGYRDKRFFIQSEDGSFVLRPWLHLQVRDTSNFRDEAKTTGNDDFQNGIEIRRARFGFDGTIATPDLKYFFNWATYRASSPATNYGGLPVLEEAWGLYHFPGTEFSIRVGQMHDPLDHETIIGSKYREPEASLQGDIFGNTDTFTQAITLLWDNNNNLRFEGGLNDGIRSANTDFRDYPNNANAYNWGVAGRLEYKIMGNWKDYYQLTAYGTKTDLLVIGAGADNSEGGRRDELAHTVDIQYSGAQGLGLYAAYFGRYIRHNNGLDNGAPVSTSFLTPGTPNKDTYEPSIFLQAAYAFGKWEPFARYEYLYFQGTPEGSKNSVHEISVGLNYYFYGHNAKFSSQLMYLPNGIPFDDTSSDVVKSNGNTEVLFIAQFQLLI